MFFFILQFYNSFLPGYFIIFFCFIYIFFLWVYKRTLFKKLFSLKNFFIVLFTLAIVIPVVKPYFDVYVKYNAARDIRDTIHLALQPEDLIYPNQHTRLEPILLAISKLEKVYRTDEMKAGYIGFIFSILSIIAIIYFFRKIKKKDVLYNSFITTGLLGLILSFGPALHWARETIHHPFPIILPYALFYYIIPGFKGFRNSQRWEVLFVFCLSVSIAIFLAYVLRKGKLKTRVIYLILILGIILEYNFPMKFYPVLPEKNFPKVYSWMGTTPKSSVFIFMPIYNWNSPGITELTREYYFTENFRNTVNGYSGFSPYDWQNKVMYLYKNFPDEKSFKIIKAFGVNYIVIDKDEYDSLYKNKYYTKGNGDYVINSLKNNHNLKLEKAFGATYVFKTGK